MSDTSSLVSAINSPGLGPKKIESNLEEQIGFKPDSVNNYLCTIFNKKTNYRDILFDGALPLHEFVPLLYEFIYNYVNKAKMDHVYMLSVITPENEPTNIVMLYGDNDKEIKKERVRDIIDNLYFVFDSLLGLFIITGNGNTPHRQGRKYRTHPHVPFNDISNSYKTYSVLKPKILSLISKKIVFNEDSKDSDSEDSEGETINTL